MYTYQRKKEHTHVQRENCYLCNRVHSLYIYERTSFLMRTIAPIKQNLFIIQRFKTQYLLNHKSYSQLLLKKNVPKEIDP